MAFQGSSDFVCFICGPTFNKRDHLLMHFKIVHKNQPQMVEEAIQALEEVQQPKTDFIREPEVLKNSSLASLASPEATGETDDKTKQPLNKPKPTPNRAAEVQKDFSCSLCPESLANETLLQEHVEQMHEIKPTVQELAETAAESAPTSSSPALTTASKSSAKKHICPQCGKSVSSSSYLARHIRYHTDERPHSCHVCHKAFKEVGALKKHEVCHSEERPFQCMQCVKAFKYKHNLRNHLATHLKKEKAKQSQCGNYLNYHKKACKSDDEKSVSVL